MTNRIDMTVRPIEDRKHIGIKVTVDGVDVHDRVFKFLIKYLNDQSHGSVWRNAFKEKIVDITISGNVYVMSDDDEWKKMGSRLASALASEFNVLPENIFTTDMTDRSQSNGIGKWRPDICRVAEAIGSSPY